MPTIGEVRPEPINWVKARDLALLVSAVGQEIDDLEELHGVELDDVEFEIPSWFQNLAGQAHTIQYGTGNAASVAAKDLVLNERGVTLGMVAWWEGKDGKEGAREVLSRRMYKVAQRIKWEGK